MDDILVRVNSKNDLIQKIKYLHTIPYTKDHHLLKKEILAKTFSDENNAKHIDSILNKISND